MEMVIMDSLKSGHRGARRRGERRHLHGQQRVDQPAVRLDQRVYNLGVQEVQRAFRSTSSFDGAEQVSGIADGDKRQITAAGGTAARGPARTRAPSGFRLTPCPNPARHPRLQGRDDDIFRAPQGQPEHDEGAVPPT
jgi:hypothetical protein